MGRTEDLWPLLLLLVSALVTYVWRGLGVLLAGRLRTDSPLFEWTASVAYALLAGLIARMLLLPAGPLAETATGDRLLAAAVAVLAYHALPRLQLLGGCAAGCGAFVLLDWLALFG